MQYLHDKERQESLNLAMETQPQLFLACPQGRQCLSMPRLLPCHYQRLISQSPARLQDSW